MSSSNEFWFDSDSTSLLFPNHNSLAQSTEVSASCLAGSAFWQTLKRFWQRLLRLVESAEKRKNRLGEERKDKVLALLFCEAMMKLRRSLEMEFNGCEPDVAEKRVWDYMYGGPESEWYTESEWTVSDCMSSLSKGRSRDFDSEENPAADAGSSEFPFQESPRKKSIEFLKFNDTGSLSSEFFSPEAKSYKSSEFKFADFNPSYSKGY